jgi:hypothetical protein
MEWIDVLLISGGVLMFAMLLAAVTAVRVGKVRDPLRALGSVQSHIEHGPREGRDRS